VDLAGRGAGAGDVLFRPRAPVCSRRAPGDRDRRGGRRSGLGPCGWHSQLRRLGAGQRAVADDRDARRVLGHAHPPARPRRREGSGRRPGSGGRDGRDVGSPRDPRHRRPAGLRRPVGVPAAPHEPAGAAAVAPALAAACVSARGAADARSRAGRRSAARRCAAAGGRRTGVAARSGGRAARSSGRARSADRRGGSRNPGRRRRPRAAGSGRTACSGAVAAVGRPRSGPAAPPDRDARAGPAGAVPGNRVRPPRPARRRRARPVPTRRPAADSHLARRARGAARAVGPRGARSYDP
jgi:hypothetical protein